MTVTQPTSAQWKTLYDACIRFRKAACWKWMTEDEMFGIENPKTGEVGYCLIIGNLGEQLGLIIYTGSDGLESYKKLSDHAQLSEEDFILFLSQKCLSITYDNKTGLEEEDIQVINELGITLKGAKQYPVIRNMTPGYVPWFVSGDEADYLSTAIEQVLDVSMRFKDNPDIIRSRRPKYLVRMNDTISGSHICADEWLLPEPIRPKAVAPAQIDEIGIMRIKSNAGKTRTTWEFTYSLENMPIHEQGNRPFYPMMLLLVETQSGLVIGSDTASPDSYQQRFIEYLLQIMASSNSYPREIMLESDEAATMLQPILSHLDIKAVKVKRCKESFKARTAMRQHLSKQLR